jgi:ATP-dependent Lhr-like helicase
MQGLFTPAAARWFTDAFQAPTPVQRRSWPVIAAGEHVLMLAPTGSGKTLAAFLSCLDRLCARPPEVEPGTSGTSGTSVLYISPVKALAYDVQRNLHTPLIGIQRAAEALGVSPRIPTVDVRTGDTPARERQRQLRAPADILVTTPESLFLLLSSQAREGLRSVHTVILDEIHAIAGTKRGVHLAVSLERLADLADTDPQRIGLSATQRPLSAIAKYLGGDRPVHIIDASAPAQMDLQVCVPVPDMSRPQRPATRPAIVGGSLIAQDDRSTPRRTAADFARPGPGELLASQGRPSMEQSATHAGDQSASHSIWEPIHDEIIRLIQSHQSTIVFTNSRGLCERLCQHLNEKLAAQEGELVVRAHHGSVARAQRIEIEEGLKSGALRAIVATSSLELGVDMGLVDLVIQVAAPPSVASGMQRIGRAGHGVGQRSMGRIFPRFPGDLLQAAAVARQMKVGFIEPTTIPKNCLDVLAQQIVAMCAHEERTADGVFALVRRAHSFSELTRPALDAVLDMLSGRYPAEEFRDLKARVVWDRGTGQLKSRRDAATLALLNAGTIPDRGTYAVHLGADGPRIGELFEEMVLESRPGQTFILGASSWRIQEITRDRVVVAPAPGEPGRLPFWRGAGPGRPAELGRAMGAFVREVGALPEEDALERLQDDGLLDAHAAGNLLRYITEQREATGVLPSEEDIVIERFRDELGDWRICILSPFGTRVHAPWATAIEAQLSERAGTVIQTLWTDDGIVVRMEAIDDELPDTAALLPAPEEVEELLLAQLASSPIFATHFRENASRALVLPRRTTKHRSPLWAQRLRAQGLLSIVEKFPSFPVVLETYREILQEVFDLPGLKALLSDIRSRKVRVVEVETGRASPFARSLAFSYVTTLLYAGDTPTAERKAQALSLDRRLLSELLGQAELRALLDVGVIAELEAELQGLAEGHRARSPDQLHDLLRRVGDLREDEVTARCQGDAAAWLAQLARQRRALPMRIAGETRIVAVEDAAMYRDALGAPPPPGLPAALLTPTDAPLERLLRRFAGRRGPFLPEDVAVRYRMLPAQVEALLRGLEARELLVHGELLPGGIRPEWCDPEVLRHIRRRTLAKLRGQVAPVEAPVLARFLVGWHGLDGRGQLERAIEQLEGAALPWSSLISEILPRRVSGFRPAQLNELGASGRLVWVGCGSLGAKDGRVALYWRERIGLLADPPPPFQPPSPLHAAILEHLEQRGASFTATLQIRCGKPALADLNSALWDLVWAGLITNDTFQPLADLSRRQPRPSGGRWSLLSDILLPAEPTVAAHARAWLLLERYGVLSREAARAEGMAGGFSSIYPVLRAMEEAGRIRRGWFVDGLTGAQFALPGAVDRLRACRQEEPEAVLLATVDPANPYGRLLPWPALAVEGASPRRAAGVSAILVGGQPAMLLEQGGRHLRCFTVDDELLSAAARGFVSHARTRRGRSLIVQKIDGVPARTAPAASLLRAAGFVDGYKGLELDAWSSGTHS